MSVDDNEFVRLEHLLCAVFGHPPEATIIRVNPSTKSWDPYISTTHDYCLVSIQRHRTSVDQLQGWKIKKPYVDEFKKKTRALLQSKLGEDEKTRALRDLARIPMFKAFDHYVEFDKRGVYAAGNPNRTLPSPGAKTYPNVRLMH